MNRTKLKKKKGLEKMFDMVKDHVGADLLIRLKVFQGFVFRNNKPL